MMCDAPALFIGMSEQLTLLLYSLLLGIFIGVLFDAVRFVRLILYSEDLPGNERGRVRNTVGIIINAVCDILFFILAAVSVVLFCFQTNYGQYRSFMLIATGAGALFYRVTVGRLTYFFSLALVRFLKRITGAFVTLTAVPLFKAFIKAASYIYKATLGRLLQTVAAEAGRIGTRRKKRAIIRLFRRMPL